MKFLLLLLLTSTILSGQSKNDTRNQIKLKSYSHLDSITTYSKDYPTALIEGSGFITDKENRNIGSIGYSINITKDKNDNIIRILKSESSHYKKHNRNPQRSDIVEITVYFDESHQPDLAKYISKIFIVNSLVTTKTIIFDLKESHEDTNEFRNIKNLLEQIKKYK